jgi:Na+-translocating ferredoxin:NAD+ oxidoreductase RnfE subunit
VTVVDLGVQMVVQVVVMHLGALHPYEKVLTVVLAFGPFIVLGTVIAVRRRSEADDDEIS